MRFVGMLSVLMSLVLGVASVAAQSPATTPEPSADDPNFLSLVILRSGVPFEGTLAGTDGGLLMVFNATEGDVVTLSAIQTEESDLDPVLVVMDRFGAVLAYNDDDFALDTPLASRIQGLTIPFTDTYFVLLSSFFNLRSSDEEALTAEPETLAFTALLEGNIQPTELAEDEFFYTTAVLTQGEPFAFEINEEREVGFLEYVGTAGERVTIDLVSPEDFLDTVLMVFDRNGTRLAADDDGGDERLAARVTDLELPADGTYLIFSTLYDFPNLPELAAEEQPTRQLEVVVNAAK
ncbi:MAG: hypothetical protein HC915_04080 [Anaerolineae bacterium]|nr:hypothetical protein [Anaerolineae bacterium]